MQQSKICKPIPIKSKHELQLFKKRQANHFDGTLKIILGKYLNDIQEVWYDDYRNCNIQQLRDLHSSEHAFDYGCLITKACHKLSALYGHFMLNENMVFKTSVDDELFVWINPDLMANQSKIFLPDSHDGELTMIKSLVNYFKLWLYTDYAPLSQAKTLQELEFKICSQKTKNHSSNAANSTKVESENTNNENKNSASTSKNMDDKYSYKSKNMVVGKYTPSIKGSEPSQCAKGLNNKIKFKHIFTNPNKKPNLSSKNSESNFETREEFAQGQQVNTMSRTTGNANSKYFPFKTTSANSKKILTLIKKADDNPDEYVSNSIKMDESKLREMEEEEKLKKTKQSLNEVGEELDNLFLSNMEEEEDDGEESIQREKEFEELLL